MQGDGMENEQSRVTIHMAASLDGFIARRDGRVDWLEIKDGYLYQTVDTNGKPTRVVTRVERAEVQRVPAQDSLYSPKTICVANG
jgi:hypothetical protein